MSAAANAGRAALIANQLGGELVDSRGMDEGRSRLTPANRQARTRTKLDRPLLVSFEKQAANDAPAQCPRPDEYPRPGLDTMIRELVRSEVRAEVERALANAATRAMYVSVAEYAAARSISVSTVRNAIRRGRLPALRIGTAVRIPVDAEIGRPVIADRGGHDANPVTRAEQILASRFERSR